MKAEKYKVDLQYFSSELVKGVFEANVERAHSS